MQIYLVTQSYLSQIYSNSRYNFFYSLILFYFLTIYHLLLLLLLLLLFTLQYCIGFAIHIIFKNKFTKQNNDDSSKLILRLYLGWKSKLWFQFSSVAHSCLTLYNPMDYSMPGFPVHHQLLELTQTHVRRVGNAIQPSHPLSSPSLSTFSLSQHQGLFQCVSSSNQVAKVLEFQLQHQSVQWIFRTDFL